MNRSKLAGLLLGLAATLTVVSLTAPARHDEDELQDRKSMPVKGTTLVIRLGLKDTEATGWGGDVQVSEGSVTSLRASGIAEADGESKWKARTKVAKKKKNSNVTPVTIYVTVDAPPTATVTVRTRQGTFSFLLAEIRDETGKTFLDDQARVARGPMSIAITDQPSDDDFPAAVTAPDGTVWVAYVAYQHGNSIELPRDPMIPRDWSSLETRGNGDQVKLIRFDGKSWSAPIDVTEPGLDVWRPAVAVTAKGVSVVWSQKVDGDWDLHSRTYDNGKRTWSAVSRMRRPGADINPALATAADGNSVWLAWQGWSQKDFDIYFQNGLPGESEPVQSHIELNANQWSPAIVVNAKGVPFIAYDSYDKGNYDVQVDSVQTAGPRGSTRTEFATNSPRFEARASLAIDKEDRVWLAYEEAAENWGKDFGTKWTGSSGVPFYLDRQIQVRILADGRVEQPKGEIPSAPIDTQYGGGRRLRLSMPRIACDGSGRIWLLYRRHPLGTGAGEVWNGFATAHSGDEWSPAIPIPNSENFIDNRPALVRLSSGSLLAVYSTDKRTNTTQSGRDNDLHACILSLETPFERSVSIPVAEPAENANSKPVHPSEAADIKRVRDFRVSVGGKTLQLLRGEFHRHTELSSHRDQDGPFEEIWRYGLDVAQMDWIGQGDHDNGQREYTWWLSQKQDDIYFHAPVFMPMFTYERSVVYPSGHRNVMFARRGIRPLPRLGGGEEQMMGDQQSGSPDVKRLYAYLKHFGGICASHTSATGMGTDWRDNDPSVEPVVEVYQGHRQNYEYEGAPQSATAGDTIGRYEPAGFIWNALRKGYRLGFEVSSDHVSTHLSYAVVLAEGPTREAIVDAFRKRHCYGAQDNIVLAVTCADHVMGDEFSVRSPPEFKIQAVGTAAIARISIIRGVGGEMPTYVYDTQPNRADVNLSWRDDTPAAGTTSYYYVRIEQSDGKLAWASPMWVKYEK